MAPLLAPGPRRGSGVHGRACGGRELGSLLASEAEGDLKTKRGRPGPPHRDGGPCGLLVAVAGGPGHPYPWYGGKVHLRKLDGRRDHGASHLWAPEAGCSSLRAGRGTRTGGRGLGVLSLSRGREVVVSPR